MQKIKIFNHGQSLDYRDSTVQNTTVRNTIDKFMEINVNGRISFGRIGDDLGSYDVVRFNHRLPNELTDDLRLWTYRCFSLHNLYGPALIDFNTGHTEYWIEGEQLTKEEYIIYYE